MPNSATTRTVARRHDPLADSTVRNFTDRGAAERAAALLGVDLSGCELALRPTAGAGQLAVTRTTAQLLLAGIQDLDPACLDCTGTDRAIDCARELGTLEARLGSLADRAALALSLLLAGPHPGTLGRCAVPGRRNG